MLFSAKMNMVSRNLDWLWLIAGRCLLPHAPTSGKPQPLFIDRDREI